MAYKISAVVNNPDWKWVAHLWHEPSGGLMWRDADYNPVIGGGAMGDPMTHQSVEEARESLQSYLMENGDDSPVEYRFI